MINLCLYSYGMVTFLAYKVCFIVTKKALDWDQCVYCPNDIWKCGNLIKTFFNGCKTCNSHILYIVYVSVDCRAYSMYNP